MQKDAWKLNKWLANFKLVLFLIFSIKAWEFCNGFLLKVHIDPTVICEKLWNVYATSQKKICAEMERLVFESRWVS